jgi:hypothetical protein
VARATVILSALTAEPTTTSDLYDRVGYAALARVGLIPYEAFRAQLMQLTAAGLVFSDTAPDGSTTWRRADQAAERI